MAQAPNPFLSVESGNWRGSFMHAPNLMYVLHGSDHVVEGANLAFLNFVGERELLGKAMRDALPEIGNQEYLCLLDQVFRTGECFIARAKRVLLKRRPNEEPEEYFLEFVHKPIKGAKDEVRGVFVECIDVTDQVCAEQRQSLLVHELHHRVRNMLAVVQSVMNMTARSAATIEDFREAFAGRIASLAKTQSALTDDLEQSVSFFYLLNQELEPYSDKNGHRIRLDGPLVKIPSNIAVPLGMAIHELTANATKHGALGHEEGRLEVDWNVVTSNGGSSLLCKWRELDGPPVSPHPNGGFGSMLINRMLAHQIGANVDVQYDPNGYCLQMAVPLPANRRHNQFASR